MLTLHRRAAVGFGVAAVALLTACEKVPLLAPTGSTITLTASTTALSANGTTPIIAQVIESSGTPPHSGTHVSFITTLGRLEPAEAETDLNGRVAATFIAGGSNGTATITALSGGATTGTNGSLKIFVGTAAVGRVSVGANPLQVAAGQPSAISAFVIDINGNPLVGTPVSFTTTAGNLSTGLSLTDGTGTATTVLTTTAQATVTASVGAQAPSSSSGTPPASGDSNSSGTTTPSASGQAQGSVTVGVLTAPSITIKPPATVQSKIAASFTFTVTAASSNGSPVKEVTVDWGDGVVQSLGAFIGDQIANHTYNSTGTYLVSATVVDVANVSNRSTTPVVVTSLAGDAVIVEPSVFTAAINTPITFTITITPPTGIGIVSSTIDYGDGQVDQLGAATSAKKAHQYATPGQKNVVVTANDTAGRSGVGTTVVAITP